MSNMLSGTPILTGDNTIPGIKIHPEVKSQIPAIEKACRDMGLTYVPIVVEFLPYDGISELASYGGFPVRYPHWKWGMTYEELSHGFEAGRHRISEMVINCDPCYIYILDSNTLVDSINVIAHAIGHNDFFTNNVFFEKTNRKMMNKFANHGAKIRKYMARWGGETVTEFIDHVLRLETLIDPAKAWEKKVIKDVVRCDKRIHHEPHRINPEHNYMEDWVNTRESKDKEKRTSDEMEAIDYLELFSRPQKDIFGYLKDHAPLKPWQQDIVSMLYEEAMYFVPQRQTKMLNEGWAMYVEYTIMCRYGMVAAGQNEDGSGIWEYAVNQMMVLGGKYSQNPYKLGYELLTDIEDRWNKGKFGTEYNECKDISVKEKWDKKLGLGKEKVFEVRKHHNDFTTISEFFTPEFCNEKQYYEYRKFPNGEWKIVNRDFNSIKKNLLQQRLNGGLPDIRLTDPNHLNRGWMFLQHYSDGRLLYESYAKETLTSIWRLWNNVVVLATKDMDGLEFVYLCDGSNPDKDVHIMLRPDYEKEFIKWPEKSLE